MFWSNMKKKSWLIIFLKYKYERKGLTFDQQFVCNKRFQISSLWMNTTILRITTIFRELPSYLQRSFDQASINNFGTKIKKCSSANSRGSFEGKGNPDSEGMRDFIIGRLQFRPFVAFNRPLLRRHRIGSRRRRPSATVQNCMHEKMHSFAEIGSAKNRKVSRRPS